MEVIEVNKASLELAYRIAVQEAARTQKQLDKNSIGKLREFAVADKNYAMGRATVYGKLLNKKYDDVERDIEEAMKANGDEN